MTLRAIQMSMSGPERNSSAVARAFAGGIAVAVLVRQAKHLVEIAGAPACRIAAGDDDNRSLLDLQLIVCGRAQALPIFGITDHDKAPGLEVVSAGRS